MKIMYDSRLLDQIIELPKDEAIKELKALLRLIEIGALPQVNTNIINSLLRRLEDEQNPRLSTVTRQDEGSSHKEE